jgi:hypothetical protein
MKEIIEQLRAALPPVFLGSASAELTGGVICWGTIQNKRSRREIPDDCFVRSGPRVLVVRDPFLKWWETTLQPARQPAVPIAPRRRGRPAKNSEGFHTNSGRFAAAPND